MPHVKVVPVFLEKSRYKIDDPDLAKTLKVGMTISLSGGRFGKFTELKITRINAKKGRLILKKV